MTDGAPEDSDGGAERRRHRRIDILAEVHLTRDADVSVFRTANASLGGLFLLGTAQASIEMRPGTDVDVILFAGEGNDLEEVAARARVVRAEPHGYALAFTSLDERNRARLAALLDHTVAR